MRKVQLSKKEGSQKDLGKICKETSNNLVGGSKEVMIIIDRYFPHVFSETCRQEMEWLGYTLLKLSDGSEIFIEWTELTVRMESKGTNISFFLLTLMVVLVQVCIFIL